MSKFDVIDKNCLDLSVFGSDFVMIYYKPDLLH